MTVTIEEQSATLTPTKRLWPEIGLWSLGALILIAYAGLWRPIWFDEFLHFAMGGMTFEYALKTIDYTTIEVNHGQTGVYMLLDWVLLQIFGANAIALRLPSLVSAALLLAAAVTFMRVRGFGYVWQYLVLLSFAGHIALMFFTGEARPYMPLAAASVSVLAYYQYRIDSRRRPWPLILGISGVIGGALFHPYIIYMIALLLPFSIWMAVRDGRITWEIKQVIRFMNLPLLITSGVLFLAIGQLTWMRRVLSFGYGPLDLMGNSWSYAIQRGVVNHFANQTTPWFWVAGLALITFIAIALSRFHVSSRIVPPLVLIAIGVLSSVAVSALSALRTYWILERQWVAGIALVAVGSVWFFAEVFNSSRTNNQVTLWIPVAAFMILTTVSAIFSLSTQARVTNQDRVAYAEFRQETRAKTELQPEQINDDAGYVYAANVNAARGGPVWTIYEDWYDNLSGMRPEFRERNPSWTGFLGDSRVQVQSSD